MVNVIITAQDGRKFRASIDAEMVETLVFMCRDHFELKRTWLERENRFVWVADTSASKVRPLAHVELDIANEEAMDMDEFAQREVGSYKAPERTGNPLSLLLGRLNAAPDDEPERGPLN